MIPNLTSVLVSRLSLTSPPKKALPKPPGTPIVTETTATSVTITWDSGNPDPVSYYIIQYRAKAPDSKYETVDGITTTRYSIGGLYPNTDYEIRVSAFNSIGQGLPSLRVEARTGEQAPASPPRNVQARIISSNAVMVRWEEPEEPNGQVRGDGHDGEALGTLWKDVHMPLISNLYRTVIICNQNQSSSGTSF